MLLNGKPTNKKLNIYNKVVDKQLKQNINIDQIQDQDLQEAILLYQEEGGLVTIVGEIDHNYLVDNYLDGGYSTFDKKYFLN